MKRIVSVSLGSHKRDWEAEATFGGQTFHLKRIGTDGDLARYRRLLEEWDGKADVLALGGLDLYVRQGKRVYAFREVQQLIKGIKTPLVDGSGLKQTLERRAVRYLAEEGILDFKGLPTLLVAGVDRFGLAEELRDRGADLCLGDMMFALGLPLPFRKWWQFSLLGRLLLPIIRLLPFKWLYPTGQSQEEIKPKYEKWYRWADLICGDFLLIKRHLPDKLPGKYILTNTTTVEDRQLLRQRGVKALITTTPSFAGRSSGSNVLEGVIMLLAGVTEYDEARYEAVLDELQLKPEINWLQQNQED